MFRRDLNFPPQDQKLHLERWYNIGYLIDIPLSEDLDFLVEYQVNHVESDYNT